ncbi:alpha/beta hydrolase [Mycobacterium tuberculosis]|uniref:alpha/beta hydrolase n=1 Tax=Mycobacterium tuberculosis TaxID=1773 RepID=UPI0008A84C2C|nr:alpha/beta hydrolase [Mycobacterium tuberculosis]OHO08160.1 hypothetical protein BBW92_17125 [Mycobacterium tuberculosis]OHO10518.1 hypothetical protein BBW94_13540 [Mycobacterium tuberculosis]OHO11760.1 hypothetical protein BBW93_13040 [Mycobacterium tuberculosis]OHO21614.1 hypothetical protein BBW91_01965 [Mycobacterium tuberculosis]
MSLKRCRALPVVAIVALVASGVITFIWSQQRRLIYFPSAGPVPSASSVLPAGRDGNAGDRSMRAELAVALHGLGLSVLLFDYRGYGGNPGRPSEQGLAADARAAQEWLSGQSDVDPARIAYFGESLGAAVAVGLAVQRPPAALVLRSPFTSLAEVGAVHYPWLPLRRLLLDHYPSIERIASVHAPVLVIAGGSDDIVPATLSEWLVAAAAEPKRYVVVPGVGHNDPELLDGRVMLDAIRRFLTETAVLGQ